MRERDRVLRPLDEARPSIERLATYESPAALQEALRATWHAMETSLRQLLRSDTAAPDDVRLRALSPDDLPFDGVLTELRRIDAISLGLAGRLHQLEQAVRRAESGDVHAADADLAQDVVEALHREVAASAAAAEPAPRGEASASAAGAKEAAPRAAYRDEAAPAGIGARLRRGPAHEAADTGADDMFEDDVARRASRWPSVLRRPMALIAVAALLLVVIVAAVLLYGRSDPMDEGIAAFRAGRGGVAEQHFRAVLQRDADNVTARLYLARVLRDQQRYQESADLLREAARRAPRDAAVRRELGYLFLDLGRPEQAAAQFQQSVELAPDEPLGWVWLVQALRRADDPAADVWLSRAPAAAQAMIRSGRSP
jgi:tetratricopeptide (TPR) repeat protein